MNWNLNSFDFLFFVACSNGEHSCGGQCIEPRRLCDGVSDCADHSDEANCPDEPSQVELLILKKNYI